MKSHCEGEIKSWQENWTFKWAYVYYMLRDNNTWFLFIFKTLTQNLYYIEVQSLNVTLKRHWAIIFSTKHWKSEPLTSNNVWCYDLVYYAGRTFPQKIESLGRKKGRLLPSSGIWYRLYNKKNILLHLCMLTIQN